MKGENYVVLTFSEGYIVGNWYAVKKSECAEIQTSQYNQSISVDSDMMHH